MRRWIFGLLLTGCGKSDPGESAGADSQPESPSDAGSDDSSDAGGGGDSEDSAETPPPSCSATNPEPLKPGTCVLQAPCSWLGEMEGAYGGYALAAGDLDGDGKAEVVMGSPYQAGAAGTYSGRVRVFSGAAVGAGADTLLGSMDGEQSYERVGFALAIVGDATGDGIGDLLAGATADSEVANYSGEVYLFAGSAGGWGGGVMTPTASWRGESEYSYAGGTVAAAGDVDGDGRADLLIGGERRELVDKIEDTGPGRVYLVLGRESWANDGSLADAELALAGGVEELAGQGLAGGGDLDGDGYPDLAVGAPNAEGYRGRVSVFPGGAALPGGTVSVSSAPFQISSESAYDAFGWSMATGDLDGDGAAELIVGAPFSDMSWPEGGAVVVYSGGPGFFTDGPSLLMSWGGDFDDEELGYGLAVGDVDGDGRGDLAAGAIYARAGLLTQSGRTHLFRGQAEGWTPGASSSTASATLHGAGASDYLGTAHAFGDINGDGKAELLLGSGFSDEGDYSNIGRIYLFWGE